jgi:hypothetical protein
MSYTVKEMHDKAISVLDELSDNGTVDPNKTKEYSNRAPSLADDWQKEESNLGKLTKTVEYENTDETTLYKWIEFDIPSDFKSIKEIMFINEDLQIGTIKYKQFGKTDIYLYFTELGTARMLYAYIPTKITLITQTLEVDDSIVTDGVFYLAEHYAMADQNDTLAARCRQKFQELKAESMVKLPMSVTSIEDVYGFSGGD